MRVDLMAGLRLRGARPAIERLYRVSWFCASRRPACPNRRCIRSWRGAIAACHSLRAAFVDGALAIFAGFGRVISSAPRDLCQVVAAQGCLLESATLNQNGIHSSMILSPRHSIGLSLSGQVRWYNALTNIVSKRQDHNDVRARWLHLTQRS